MIADRLRRINARYSLRNHATGERRNSDDRDQGSALVMALACTLLCSLVAAPMLTYGTTISRAGRVVSSKAINLEAAKAGLRVALADPASLYKVCDASGITVGYELPSAGLERTVNTKCYKMEETTSQAPGAQRIAATTTLVGSSVPAGLFGVPYTGSGGSPETAWRADSVTVAEDGKIWLPNLPSRALNLRSNAGHLMPAGYPTCLVYFPGTYTDDVVLTSSTPTYFASGTYYFQKTLRVSGNANVVFGGGTYEGCTTDQEAAFYATDAPTTHQISGLGATFVFGSIGKFVLDTATAGTSMSVIMNRRYVATQDVSALPGAGVSMMTVNGSLAGGVSSDLDIAGQLSVPKSMVGLTDPTTLESQSYTPSTLIPGTATPGPVFEVNLTDNRTVTLKIPGYLSMPQGAVSFTASSAAAAANKNIKVDGGVIAATLSVSATRPSTLQLGLVNPVVQRLFRIVSVAPGSPGAVSTAMVQVNENGAYSVNSWEVQ